MNTFIYDASTKVVQMRKKDAGRRKILLDCARRIECEEGVDAVSIRRLASEANVAVGTVYNYFESKQSVLLELTEEYWGNILRAMQSVVTASRFSGQLRQIYTFLTVQMNDCAGILMQNLSGTGDTAQEKMAAMQRTLERAIAGRLEQIGRFVRTFGASASHGKRLRSLFFRIFLRCCVRRTATSKRLL
jgi:AcrR family transcriptional regulator